MCARCSLIKSSEHEVVFQLFKITSRVNCRVDCNDICRTHCVEHDRKLVNKLVERNKKLRGARSKNGPCEYRLLVRVLCVLPLPVFDYNNGWAVWKAHEHVCCPPCEEMAVIGGRAVSESEGREYQHQMPGLSEY
jgi:hypothetical protein